MQKVNNRKLIYTAISALYSLILSMIVHELGTIVEGNLIILHKSQLLTSNILSNLSYCETLTILQSSLEKDIACIGPID